MNYGEEYAFWYLRLNGFFPLSNFVIHKSGDVSRTSDCDVLAVRPPYVFEEIGGREGDWDGFLRERFDFARTVGLVCEIKTGEYDEGKIFRRNHVAYCIGRLGFCPQQDVGALSGQLDGRPSIDVGADYQIGKLLIASDESEGEGYFYASLHSVISFLERRVAAYPMRKYSDRMFFGSILFQSVIDRVALGRDGAEVSTGA